MRERAERLRTEARATIVAAREAGVPIAAGFDSGPHGANASELVRLVDAGLTSSEALQAATTIAARACGLDDRIGRIAPGFAADLLVVDRDPITEIAVLTESSSRWLIIQAGEVVAGRGMPE
jgi:imidazolonepropionase-like amidohydrolase